MLTSATRESLGWPLSDLPRAHSYNGETVGQDSEGSSVALGVSGALKPWQSFLQEAALSLGLKVTTAFLTFFENCFAGFLGTLCLFCVVR